MQKSSELWLVEPGYTSLRPPKPRRWWASRLAKIAGMLLILTLLVICGLLFGAQRQSIEHNHSSSASSSVMTVNSINTSSTGVASGQIEVDVHGDVRHPGIVKLPANARVADAIQAAGGLLHTADAQDVDSAALLWDGEELDVAAANAPPIAATMQNSNAVAVPSPVAASNSTQNTVKTSGGNQRIDLNTADQATLETLPGVGPARAAAIIQYRQIHGPFQSLNDLANVKGIGPKSIANWQSSLYIADAGDGKRR